MRLEKLQKSDPTLISLREAAYSISVNTVSKTSSRCFMSLA